MPTNEAASTAPNTPIGRPLRVGVVGLISIGGGSSGTAGGVETAVEEITTRLAQRGHTVTVFCRKKYNRSGQTEFRGVHLRNLPAIYTKHLESPTHTFLSTLAAIPGSDVIHLHAMASSVYAWIPRLFGRKTVVTVHGLDWRRAKWGPIAQTLLKLGERAAIYFPNRTAVVSHFLEGYYKAKYSKAVVYIPNGVPEIPYRPLDKLKRFGIEPGRYILYLSRIVPEKGSHYLIEAFRNVKTDMKLIIVGDSRHADEYLQNVKSLAQGDDRIIFTGPLYGEEKEEAYSNAHIFCLPSDLEGLPIVLLEAMGNGRCSLVSDIPEMVEVVDPKRLGFAISPGAPVGPYGHTFKHSDPADLTVQLQHLLDSPELVAETAKKAQEFVRTEYNWDHIALSFERVYQDLVEKA